MSVSIQDIDYTALSPVQKMELADILYDVAQQELEASSASFTDEQMQEIDRRIAASDAGKTVGEPWEQVHERLK